MFVIVLISIIIPVSAYEPEYESRVTDYRTDAYQKVAIFNKIIAWEDKRNDNSNDLYTQTNIYTLDLITGESSRIRPSEFDQEKPKIFDKYILFIEKSTQDSLILYNIETKESQILSNNVDEYYDIDGNYVVWSDFTDDTHGDLIVYDIETQERMKIFDPSHPYTEKQPAISGNNIVFVYSTMEGWKLGVYNIITREITDIRVLQNYGVNGGVYYGAYPDISDDIVVWEDNRNGNIDIFAYNLITKEEIQVCLNSAHQDSPRIFQNKIVYYDKRNGNYDIFLYDLDSREETTICDHYSTQYFPDIYGNLIAYTDFRKGIGNIYIYSLNGESFVPYTGELTITCSGDWAYDLGETIGIAGVNSDSRSTYLLLTGEDLPAEGVKLEDISVTAETYNSNSFTRVSVEDGWTWYYDWNTSEILGGPLKAGEYTIYAVTDPINVLDLEDAVFDNNPIIIRNPQKDISIEIEGGEKHNIGDIIKISGVNAESDITYLLITGYNLDENGVKLDDFEICSLSDISSSFVDVVVNDDDAWQYYWDTSQIGQQMRFTQYYQKGRDIIIPGNYTVYAISEPKNLADLNDAKYASSKVNLTGVRINSADPSPKIPLFITEEGNQFSLDIRYNVDYCAIEIYKKFSDSGPEILLDRWNPSFEPDQSYSGEQNFEFSESFSDITVIEEYIIGIKTIKLETGYIESRDEVKYTITDDEYVDLSINGIILDPYEYFKFLKGVSATFIVIISNQGNKDIIDTFDIKLYLLSDDQDVDNELIEIGSTTISSLSADIDEEIPIICQLPQEWQNDDNFNYLFKFVIDPEEDFNDNIIGKIDEGLLEQNNVYNFPILDYQGYDSNFVFSLMSEKSNNYIFGNFATGPFSWEFFSGTYADDQLYYYDNGNIILGNDDQPVITEKALTFYNSIKDGQEGSCLGISISSLLLYQGGKFASDLGEICSELPDWTDYSFPENVKTTRDYILYYQIQNFAYNEEWDKNYYKNEDSYLVYTGIRDRIKSQSWRKDPMVLIIPKHAIVPISATDSGYSGIIKVYDSNRVNLLEYWDNKVYVNFKENIADYIPTLANKDEQKALDINLQAIRVNGFKERPRIPDSYESEYTDIGDLLYTNTEGNQLGYVEGHFVDELSNSYKIDELAGDVEENETIEFYRINDTISERKLIGADNGTSSLIISRPHMLSLVNISLKKDDINLIDVLENESGISIFSENGSDSLELSFYQDTVSYSRGVIILINDLNPMEKFLVSINEYSNDILIENQGEDKFIHLIVKQAGLNNGLQEIPEEILVENDSQLVIIPDNWNDLQNSDIIIQHDIGSDGIIDYIEEFTSKSPNDEFSLNLSPGWSLFSTPVTLDPAHSTFDKIFSDGDQQHIQIILGWDGNQWFIPDSGYHLLPLDALVIKTDDTVKATLIPSSEISAPSSRVLTEGINLVGCAPACTNRTFESTSVDESFQCIGASQDGPGYVMVISPAWNQPGWACVNGDTTKDLIPFKGYWVIMENTDILYGFSTTPLI